MVEEDVNFTRRNNKTILGSLSEEIVPQVLMIDNINKNSLPNSRHRSNTAASALSTVGFKSIATSSNNLSTAKLSSISANESTTPPNTKFNNETTIKNEGFKKRSNTLLSTNFQVSLSNSSFDSFNDDQDNIKHVHKNDSLALKLSNTSNKEGNQRSSNSRNISGENKAKKFSRLFGRNKDSAGSSGADKFHENWFLDKKFSSKNAVSLLDSNKILNEMLSASDPENELVNVSKILNHSAGIGAYGSSNSQSAKNVGFNTNANLDHLMKQDAMLSEREYHYMYDLLKNYSGLESQFAFLKLKSRTKIINDLILVINDINYAVINEDYMLPKTENLHKIIFLCIKLSFLNTSLEYKEEEYNGKDQNFYYKSESSNKQNSGSTANGLDQISFQAQSSYSSGSKSAEEKHPKLKKKHVKGKTNTGIESDKSKVNSNKDNSKDKQYTVNNGSSLSPSVITNSLLFGIIHATTVEELFAIKMPIKKFEYITKKIYTFLINFYNKIFKDLIYMMENQLIYRNSDEKILNNPIKRLNFIWQNFNSTHIPNMLILNNDFQIFTKMFLKKFGYANVKSDLKTMLLETFRDCVIMPIFENYDAIIFKNFLEQQKSLTNNDKLLFLQCLGVLELSIVKDFDDKNQQILKVLIKTLRENMIVF